MGNLIPEGGAITSKRRKGNDNKKVKSNTDLVETNQT